MAAVCSILVVLGQSISLAQGVAARSPLQPSDTTSPKATLHIFLEASTELYELAKTKEKSKGSEAKFLAVAERIRDCLDLSALPAELRDSVEVESAVYLKEVLDRIKLPGEKEIPGATAADGKPIALWRIPGTRLTIVRADEGPQKGAYLFSAETVRRAAKFYGVAKHLPYRKADPKVSRGFHDLYKALTKRQPTLSADTSSPRGTLTLFLDKTHEVFELIRSQKYINRFDPKYPPLLMQIYSCLEAEPACTKSVGQPIDPCRHSREP